MTPIERSAHALADKVFVKRIRDCENPDAPPLLRPFGWENLSEIERTTAMEAVRAVIAAIREPSEEMVAEAVGYDVDIAWPIMIDALLEEGK